METNNNLLDQISHDILNLTTSPLYQYRIKNNFLPVVGEGNSCAKIMFIAEAPGIHEVKTGHHFQGKSGEVFNQLLKSISLNRSDIYITNIIKDKLPNNRDPLPQEIDVYSPFLIRQIQIIKPRIIVTLGKFSTEYLLKICHIPSRGVNNMHGQAIKIHCSYKECTLFPMFHPAAGLYNPALLKNMTEDFTHLKKYLT